MSDFTAITARHFTGAAITSEKDVGALVRAGVTHVIDCRDDFDDARLLASHPLIHYLWNGTPDDGKPKPPHWFAKSIGFALDGLSHRRCKVYAHCKAGINRGPSTIYAVMRAQGFPRVEAEHLIRSRRPQVHLAYRPDADDAITALHYD